MEDGKRKLEGKDRKEVEKGSLELTFWLRILNGTADCPLFLCISFPTIGKGNLYRLGRNLGLEELGLGDENN